MKCSPQKSCHSLGPFCSCHCWNDKFRALTVFSDVLQRGKVLTWSADKHQLESFPGACKPQPTGQIHPAAWFQTASG